MVISVALHFLSRRVCLRTVFPMPVLLALSALLVGCALQIDGNQPPEQIAKALKNKRVLMTAGDPASELGGAKLLNMYLGAMKQSCLKAEGQWKAETKDFALNVGVQQQMHTPLVWKMMCHQADVSKEGWMAEVAYGVNVLPRLAPGSKTVDFHVFFDHIVVTSEAELERRKEQAEIDRSNRLAQQKQIEEQRMAEVQRQRLLLEERQSKATVFRADLKVGDRIQLFGKGTETRGLVVEVKRPLVLVQFDLLEVQHQSTRWVRIDEIEQLQR